MGKLFRDFLSDRLAATAIEYGLIGTLVAVAIVAGVTAVGSSLNDTFAYVSEYALGDGKLGQ